MYYLFFQKLWIPTLAALAIMAAWPKKRSQALLCANLFLFFTSGHMYENLRMRAATAPHWDVKTNLTSLKHLEIVPATFEAPAVKALVARYLPPLTGEISNPKRAYGIRRRLLRRISVYPLVLWVRSYFPT
jgi:hypothetical protein